MAGTQWGCTRSLSKDEKQMKKRKLEPSNKDGNVNKPAKVDTKSGKMHKKDEGIASMSKKTR